MAREITPRQDQFAKEYIANGLNGLQAAIKAGCPKDSAGVQASKWLKNPRVKARIGELLAKVDQKLDVSVEKLAKLAETIADGNIFDYIRVDAETGQADINLKGLTRERAAAIQEISVDTTGGSGDGERRQVLRTRVKLKDGRGWAELLAKYKGMLTEKVEHSGPDGGPIVTNINVRFIAPNGQ